MSIDHVVSSDLAVLATENRRAVPSVDAVLRKAGIGQGAGPSSAALVSLTMPTSAAVLAMAQAFSRRVGRATVGAGLFATGILTVVAIARLPYQVAETEPSLMVNDFVLGRRGIVLALLLAPIYMLASRIAAGVFRLAIESAATDAAAREAGARLLRRVDVWTFALGLVGFAALMMIGGFLWYVGFHPEPDLGLFMYRALPMAWRAIELFAVFGGGVIVTIAMTILVRREARSPRASRIVALLSSTRVLVTATALCIATVAVIELAPVSARWTGEYVQDYEVTEASLRAFNRCRPDCVGDAVPLEVVPGSYGSDRLRIALTLVGGIACFMLATGLALRRRRREHEI